jgi:hypothetical protein
MCPACFTIATATLIGLAASVASAAGISALAVNKLRGSKQQSTGTTNHK